MTYLSVKVRISKLLADITGKPSDFPLNARIFNSVLPISIIALAYNVPFNFFIGLPKIAAASLTVAILCCLMYYFSRFKKKSLVCIYVTNFIGLTLFTGNYFLNSGISGPTDLFFLLFLLLSIAISPASEYKIWIPINIGIVLSLHVFEYYYPEYIPNTYVDRFSKFVDQTSAYMVVALVAYFCMDYIRRSYDSEKESVLEKSKSIEEKNSQILIQNQELELLNTEKNKLMSIIAHDLRSPLASIQNYLEMLIEYDLNDLQKHELERELLNSTKETSAMLSKLLTWSKSQLHGVAAYPKNLNLNRLLEDTLNSEKAIAERKGIVLDYYFDNSVHIYADRDMMQLIVRNFVGNAIKFTPAGGSITLRAEVADENCLISIQDTGIGISPERQDAIFSLKAQSTYGTKGEKGVGLGLLLCMDYINAQNGKIWFVSAPETGTCFHISIPLCKHERLLIV